MSVSGSDPELTSSEQHGFGYDGRGYESTDIFAEDSEESAGNVDSEPESDEEVPVRKKPMLMKTPVSRGLNKGSSASPKKTTSDPHFHKSISSTSLLKHTPKTIPRRHAPKVLNMGASSCGQNENFSSALGELTNMLGVVIERLDRHESKLESMERVLKSPSSSATSGSDHKRTVPPVVRVRAMYCK